MNSLDSDSNRKILTRKNSLCPVYDYLPSIGQENIQNISSQIVDRAKQIIKNTAFLTQIQKEFNQFSNYTNRINLDQFENVYHRNKGGFQAYFGLVASPKLFNFFDEDGDGYLYFEEQMQVFTVTMAVCFYLLEELNFYGLYDYIPGIRAVIDNSISTTSAMDQTLRSKLYQQRNDVFHQRKENKLGRISDNLNKELEHFKTREEQEWNEFEYYEIDLRNKEIKSFEKKRKQILSLNKSSFKSNYLLQEKLLGAVGLTEEAKNTAKICQGFLETQQKVDSIKIKKVLRNIESNFANSVSNRHVLIEDRLVKERERIKMLSEQKYTITEKCLKVAENKIKKVQEKETLNSTYSFVKMCKFVLAKSENSLKRDFIERIDLAMRSIFENKRNHSFVFKLVFEMNVFSLFLAVSEKKQIENLKMIRDSDFNVRISLHNIESLNRFGNDEKMQEQKPKIVNLCRFYDDNLEPIV